LLAYPEDGGKVISRVCTRGRRESRRGIILRSE
jgi:hypothetical protein